ncbi:hypothetical protein PR202_gb13676 [Eleusine coracana subsp. coracana]|uniref:AAA+ ATPase domain-containing protein n=1 Tax=Eleusine coracana subsp. coracana TaxID=191504 RepID=A0AAV5EUC4_ELECO|nr:hypothetical protein PR202_gb13676 [Eleusine coracana subsp. coracana]
MALVTGALSSVVIPKLALLLKEEYDLQTGVRKKITRLSRDLESMHAVLRKVADVPPEQLDDEVKLWARDVRELSYDIEDILDTFLVRVDAHGARDPNRFKRAAKKISKMFSKSKARHQIGGMIKIINEQADVVAERHRRYRAEDIVAKPATTSTVDPRLEVMCKQVTQLVGIEKPSGDLISMLSVSCPQGNDGSKMKMVSVVGTGGLGKTTLAKTVYDKLKVDFQCMAFVPVGREPDLKKVFIDILIELNKDKYMDPKYRLLDPHHLIKELREFLQDKRYLIVIDDIWKIETWKRINYALVENNNGSIIIITTRHSDVADKADVNYKLEPLPRGQSEKLFYTRIFGTNGTCPNNQLEEVSEKILNKCHGVPLAIITMASLLVGKTPGQWIEVGKSVFREKGNQQVSDTEWILSLSYYDLPAHLKTCLLYLSVFPEDYVIDKERLIWKWIAEGFIHKEEPGTRLFEIGEGYFNELINRSMIQAVQSEGWDSFMDRVYGCRIHDVVLDLLRLKSKEENFVTISGNNEGTSSSSNRVHRLACQNRILEQTHQDIKIKQNHLRTFIASSCNVLATGLTFESFKLLRVLALEDCNDVNLEHVDNLLHLRYLGLKGTETCKLPEGVGALKLLQTLDFDLAFNKEKEDAPDKLPSSLGLLSDLICLRAGLAMVPNGVIKKLTSLEELQMSTSYDDTQSNAGYYTSRHFVEDLGNLRELRVLIADFWVGEGEEECTELDLVKSLSNLKKIQHLELDCQILMKYQTLWDTVVLPQSLRCLVARHIYFSALPSWINSSALPNLISLDLTVRSMDEQGLKILGRLPMLRHLKLNIPSVWLQEGPKITIDAAEAFFQKLRSLSVPCSTVWFVLNENSSVSFTLFKNTDVDFGSKNRKRDECRVALPTILPDLQLLCFEIKMQETLIRNKLSCANLGLKYLHSLQKVKVTFLCEDGAFADEAYKQKAALRHAVYSHPNRPTLEFVH